MSKNVMSITLIVFVCFSIGYLIYSEMNPNKEHNAQQTVSASSSPPNPTAESTLPLDKNQQEKITVYYFHGTFRCPTCRAIEDYTKQAIKEKFAKELNEGKVEIKTINVEEPENQHFIEDFKLVTRCVVVEKVVGNKPQEWTKLEKVWDYIHGSKEDFFRYIQENIQKYLS